MSLRRIFRRLLLSSASVGVSFLLWGTLVARTEDLIARISGTELVRPGHLWTTWGGIIVIVAFPVTALAIFSWAVRRVEEVDETDRSTLSR